MGFIDLLCLISDPTYGDEDEDNLENNKAKPSRIVVDSTSAYLPSRLHPVRRFQYRLAEIGGASTAELISMSNPCQREHYPSIHIFSRLLHSLCQLIPNPRMPELPYQYHPDREAKITTLEFGGDEDEYAAVHGCGPEVDIRNKKENAHQPL
jgi:hypothetical protein